MTETTLEMKIVQTLTHTAEISIKQDLHKQYFLDIRVVHHVGIRDTLNQRIYYPNKPIKERMNELIRYYYREYIPL